MSKTLQDLTPHPARSLLPALAVMQALGFDGESCLEGTGLVLSQLDNSEAAMSLQQELTFYRNTLQLTGDPAIGLKLGQPYLPQRYGLFGYALLSAASFRHALSLTRNFGKLTFSFFTFDFGVRGKRAWFSMTEPPPIEQALIDLYLDRDMSAAAVAFSEVFGQPFTPLEAHLSHDGHGRQQVYRQHFGCDTHFASEPSRFVFDSALLEQDLPRSDPDSSRHFQQQCQLLITKLTNQSHFIDDVRMLILARPGYVPDIDYLAEKLGMSSRTLRRRLQAEGSSYRLLLDEVRYHLAREYLDNTRLPMTEVSRLLGYTEAGNFSHAFRRWSGRSPSQWRKQRAYN